MKRIFAIGLTVVMLLSMSISSLADSVNGLTLTGDTELEGNLLSPGYEYTYPIGLVVDGNPANLDEEYMSNHRILATITDGGELLTHAKVESRDGGYVLVIGTKGDALQTPASAEIELELFNQSEQEAKYTTTVAFQVGWQTMDIDGIVKGEDILVSAEYPLISGEDLKQLSELNDGEELTFVGEGWSYTVDPTKFEGANLAFSNSAISAIENQFDEEGRIIQYARFLGGVGLGAEGKLTIDVGENTEDFDGDCYVYRYVYGRMYRYPSSFNSESGTVSITASVADNFIVTNMPITEGTVVDGYTQEDVAAQEDKNPDTSSREMIGLAVGAGAVALVALFAMIKRSR